MVKLFKRLVLLVVAVVILLGVIGFLTADRTRLPVSSPEPERKPTAPVKTEPPVVGTAMMAVKRYLKSPESAAFPPSNEWATQELKPGHWRVAGEVTSVNSFNARVREPVAVEMFVDDDDMRVVFVKIGDRVALDVRNGGGR